MSWFHHLRAAGRPIAYYPQLAKPLGGVNAVILFSHFLYWNERSDCALGVYKSAAEIEDETGLSVQEQRTARKRLRDLGILIETEKRIEHRIYFRLNEAAFDALMDATFADEGFNIPEMQNQHSGSGNSTFADEGFNTRGVAIQHSFKEQKTTSENYQKTTAVMGVCADAPPATPPPPEPKPAKAKKPKRDEPTRIPEDFAPSESSIDWFASKGYGFDRDEETEKFCDYWRAARQDSAWKMDWQAAWKTWMRKTNEGFGALPLHGQPPLAPQGRTFDQQGREVSPAAGMPMAGAAVPQRTSKVAQGIAVLEEMKEKIRRGEI